MSEIYQNTLILSIPLVLELLGLLIAVRLEPYITRKHERIMLIILLLEFILILENIANAHIETVGTMPVARTAVSILGYSLRPAIIVMFFYLIDEGGSKVPAWILIAINTCIYLTAFFTDIAFQIDADNTFHRGPLGYTAHVISAVLLAWLIVLSMRRFLGDRHKDRLIPIINAGLILAGVIADSTIGGNMPVDFLTIAVVNASVFYYIWLYMQFIRESEKALMAEQRIKIMMSQIQPHFLYNTLSTIQALCKADPDKAADVTEKFGTYLRQNLDSLSQTSLVPLEKELEHTRTYAEIEAVRFPKITVEYEIADSDFTLPALTIQPLVENDIRHGVRGVEGGRVTVSTKKAPGYHVVTVTDNGKGFDVEAVRHKEGSHIGLTNVRERIEDMTGGTMKIESEIGEGTKISIKIPDDETDDGHLMDN